jgi:hypothetical protein
MKRVECQSFVKNLREHGPAIVSFNDFDFVGEFYKEFGRENLSDQDYHMVVGDDKDLTWYNYVATDRISHSFSNSFTHDELGKFDIPQFSCISGVDLVAMGILTLDKPASDKNDLMEQFKKTNIIERDTA